MILKAEMVPGARVLVDGDTAVYTVDGTGQDATGNGGWHSFDSNMYPGPTGRDAAWLTRNGRFLREDQLDRITPEGAVYDANQPWSAAIKSLQRQINALRAEMNLPGNDQRTLRNPQDPANTGPYTDPHTGARFATTQPGGPLPASPYTDPRTGAKYLNDPASTGPYPGLGRISNPAYPDAHGSRAPLTGASPASPYTDPHTGPVNTGPYTGMGRNPGDQPQQVGGSYPGTGPYSGTPTGQPSAQQSADAERENAGRYPDSPQPGDPAYNRNPPLPGDTSYPGYPNAPYPGHARGQLAGDSRAPGDLPDDALRETRPAAQARTKAEREELERAGREPDMALRRAGTPGPNLDRAVNGTTARQAREEALASGKQETAKARRERLTAEGWDGAELEYILRG